MNYSELRRLGRESLRGKWGLAIGALILAGIISSIFPIISMINLMISISTAMLGNSLSGHFQPPSQTPLFLSDLWIILVAGAFSLGAIQIYLHIARREETSIGDLFTFFKSGKLYGRSILYVVLVGIYTVLWTLLLVVPGIIKTFSYAMTPYILNDQPELSVNEAITKSREIMNGHKWQFFVLGLTFIGWWLLSVITLGIGFLWLIPYVQTSIAQFYLKVSGQQA